ncbi:MAG: hypothetical protein ATN36_08530 [Epulopiscium sp. Nele67-Bin005]|nr:MAG: hypothetical protein ATN36_08530 [Epulopiscium sp. Nele67-Bin005]
MGNKNSLGSRVQIREIIKNKFRYKTIFGKLFTIYGSMLFLFLFTSLFIFVELYRAYFINYIQNSMLNHATLIANTYEQLAQENSFSESTFDTVIIEVNVLSSMMNASTWLVDKQNNMLSLSDVEEEGIIVKNLMTSSDIEKVFTGESIKILHGFEEYFSDPVVSVGYPIRINGVIDAALIIHAPMPELIKTVNDVYLIAFSVAVVAGCAYIFIIYNIAKKLTEPIKNMSYVARDIANGNFEQEIKIDSYDELGELADAFNHMAKKLNDVDASRKTFVANVSHDMRSPLTSMRGYMMSIVDGVAPPEKIAHYNQIVLDQTERLIKLTNDLLELNRLEDGRFPLNLSIFDIHELIRDLVYQFEWIIKDKDIKFNLVLDGNSQLVEADDSKIIRVLQNLLDNACKFVDIGGTIEIETVVDKSKLWVVVKNTGTILPNEELERVWDRFYKSDSSRGENTMGMGLGLVIVKEIIKQHNETVAVEIVQGSVIKFYFSLERIDD